MRNFISQLFVPFLFFIFSPIISYTQCPNSITGFTELGEFEDSKYYISDATARPVDAQAEAASHGGYLVTINSQEENDFIQQGADGLTYIGLNDENIEGTLEWFNGEAFSYNNINPCGFCNPNSENQDYAVIQSWDGGWSFSNFWNQRKYIMEIPCGSTGGFQVNCDLNIDPAQLTVEGTNDLSGNIVDWTAPTATTDCPGGVTIEQISGMPSGSFLTAWFDNIVVYEITDACGNSEICYSEIFIEGTYGDIECPTDIIIEATSPDGAIVNYNEPAIIQGTCIIGGLELVSGNNTASGSLFPIGTTTVEYIAFANGSTAFCQTFRNCTFEITVTDGNTGGGCPDDISGFTTLGEFGNSKYYISDGIARPVDAQAEALSHGGYLATISSQEENDFIQQNISEMSYIGLNDYDSEGNLVWFNGEAFTFDNVNPCGFCNENSAEMDFVIMAPWNGEWSFSNFWNQRKYVMEVPCGNNSGVDECSFTSTFSTANSVGNVNIAEIVENNSNYELVSEDLDFTTSNKIFTYDLTTDNGTFLNSSMTQINYNPNNSPPFPATYWDRMENVIYTAKKENDDVVLTKYDEQGNVIFTKNIDVSNFDFFSASSLKVFSDVILITANNGGTTNLPVIKTDLNGNLIWKKQIEVSVPNGTYGYVYGESAAGGHYLNYLLGGPHIVKIDEDGNLEFEANIGTTDPPSEKRALIGESGDGSAFFMRRNSNNSFQGFVSRFEVPTGNVSGLNLGEAYANGSNAYTSRHLAGIPTNDGGYVVFYRYALGSNPSNPSTYLYERYDANWNLVWSHEWTPFMTDMFANGANFTSLATEDGGFLLGYKTAADEYTVIRMTSEGLFEPDCGGGTGGDLSDLTVSNITNLPASGNAEEVISFNFDLNNIGTVTATGSYVTNIFLSESPTYNSANLGFFVGTVPTGDTPVGTFDVPAEITVPVVPTGDYFLTIVVDQANFITELNENNNTFTVPFTIGSGVDGCPTSLPGFTSLGEFNSSAYFLSNDVSQPAAAQVAAEALGGNLVTISSQAENDFLFNQINELVYIGINDATTEGTLEWVDGSSVGFTNFDICSFCNENTSNFDYAVMHSWNGGWSWSSVWNPRKYIIEIPCTGSISAPNVNSALIAIPTTNEREKLTFDKLMPNPANQNIFASIFSSEEKEIEIQIIDARGVVVKSEIIGVHEGNNTIEININELSNGFFMMVVPEAQKQQAVQRFLKLRD